MKYSLQHFILLKNLDLEIFPRTSKEQWKQLAEKQLKGADPDVELTWKNDAEIKLEAYYDKSDTEELNYLQDFFGKIESHRWKLYERVEVTNEKEANSKALKALIGGCDGIIFNLKIDANTDSLLKDIDSNICDVSIVSSVDNSFNLEVANSITNENCIFEEEHFTSPISQLAHFIRKIENQKFIHRTAFADFFLEISAVRALRYLLDQPVHIHTQVSKHQSKEHQWFLNTTAGLASILGGTHSIDFSTSIGDARISRNTGNLIREESGIEEYSDQCGGSYYIEVLTDRIIKGVKEKLEK